MQNEAKGIEHHGEHRTAGHVQAHPHRAVQLVVLGVTAAAPASGLAADWSSRAGTDADWTSKVGTDADWSSNAGTDADWSS